MRRQTSGPRWIAIDVAKRHIDVAHGRDGAVETIARTSAALTAWAQTLPRTARIVIEATGGLEQFVTTVVRARGLEVCVVEPAPGARLCEGHGTAGKTDRLDARVLAHFGLALALA
jgi:transposase